MHRELPEMNEGARASRARLGPAGAATILCVGLFVLGGCATTRLDNAEKLAEAGLKTSWKLSQDVKGMSRQLAEGDAAMAFSATWNACRDIAGKCSIATSETSVQEQRAELARVVLLRSQAISALHRAYASFQKDVKNGAEDDVDNSIKTAAFEAGSYASSLVGVGMAGSGARIVSKSINGSIRYLASLGTRSSRERRIRRSSQELALTLQELGDALDLETRMFDALAEVLVREKIEAHRALLQAGLVSGSDTLRPVADSLKLSLSRDAEATLAKSPAAQAATQAVVEASERAETRRVQARYRAALSALRELQALHIRLDEGAAIDLALLEEHLSTIDALVGTPDPPVASQRAEARKP